MVESRKSCVVVITNDTGRVLWELHKDKTTRRNAAASL
jgi:hypothetical protein